MAVVKKISELVPKGSALGVTDLLVVGVDNGTDYDLKSVTGAQLLGTVVSQTITDGVTTKSPSENAVFDKLKEYDSLSSSQNTSTAIRFDKKFIHADTDISGKFIGLTGNITVSTGVGIGTLNVNTQSLLIHNHSSIPTFSSEFIKAHDSLDYKINVDNYIICTLINQNPFKVSYRIVRDTNDLRLITTAESTILSNTSGTNTGDETITTIKTKLGITTLSGSNTGDQDLSTLLVKNTAITGATKTKITYDSKGLVTSGADATTSDIADSLNKRYVTDANLTTIGNTSGTNTGDQIISDATITITDITTNNVSSTKHGFAPKTPNNTTTFLRGDGTWATPSAGGLTYFTEAQNTTAPNATVPVDSLTAVTGTTNGDFAILPKGTGAFIVGHIPDGTTTNGGKRGIGAIELMSGSMNFYAGAQGVNSVAIGTQVEAKGSNSLAIGRVLTASNTGSIAIGTGSGNSSSGVNSFVLNGGSASNTNAIALNGGSASGINSLAGGANATASATCSFAFGGAIGELTSATALGSVAFGIFNIADATGSFATGYQCSTKGVASRFSMASYDSAGPYIKGESQASISSTARTSTTNTAVELITNGGTSIALVLQNNEAIRVKGSIIGKQSATTNVTCYDFDCVIVRGTTAASTVIKVSNMNLVWDDIICTVLPTLTANTISGGLSIKSGGKLTTTIKWSCRIDSTESILA